MATYYPPGIRLIGGVALALGGMSVAGPILAQNLVFVPLLALGVLSASDAWLGGPRAGLLAVVFALGSPLIAEQFHVFMLDAPQAALVAVAVVAAPRQRALRARRRRLRSRASRSASAC